MRRFLGFLKQIIESESGVSSKRFCGVLGFVAVLAVLAYCTVNGTQAPVMVDDLVYAVCLLLGLDSVTGIFKSGKAK